MNEDLPDAIPHIIDKSFCSHCHIELCYWISLFLVLIAFAVETVHKKKTDWGPTGVTKSYAIWMQTTLIYASVLIPLSTDFTRKYQADKRRLGPATNRPKNSHWGPHKMERVNRTEAIVFASSFLFMKFFNLSTVE